jgi:excisionase family DNA binding protein
VIERLLTARELADYLGLKPATILDKWERGELPGFKFGRAVRFDLEEVLAVGRQDGPGAGGEVSPTPTAVRPRGVVSQLSPTPQRGGQDAS